MKSCIMLLLWGYFLLVTFLLAGPLKTTPPSHGCDSGSSQKVTQLLSAALKQCSRGEKKKHFSLKCCVLHCRLRARSPVRGKRPAGNLKASPGLFCLLHILQHACFVFFLLTDPSAKMRWSTSKSTATAPSQTSRGWSTRGCRRRWGTAGKGHLYLDLSMLDQQSLPPSLFHFCVS